MCSRHFFRLDDAHQKLEEYASEIEKFLSLIQDLKEHQSELQSKVSALTTEKSGMEAQMGEISINIDKLKQIIGSQELSVDDVRKMERQKVRLEEQRAQKQKILDGHLNAIKEANERYAKCYDLLTAAVTEYNSKARDLEMIPSTAKNAHGKKVEICLTEGAENVEEMLGLDIGGVVSHVKKVGEGYVKETREEKRRTREMKERIEGMEAEIEELNQEIEVSWLSLSIKVMHYHHCSHILRLHCSPSMTKSQLAKKNPQLNNKSSNPKSRQSSANCNFYKQK